LLGVDDSILSNPTFPLVSAGIRTHEYHFFKFKFEINLILTCSTHAEAMKGEIRD